MSKRDYYEVLGVERDAPAEVIKKCYRKLALELHPDRNPDDESATERFKEASEAYHVLSDADKRAVYDRYGHEGLKGSQGFGDVQDVFTHFQDIFADFFGMGGGGGRRGRADGAARGEDLQTQVRLSLTEAATGLKKELTVQGAESCGPCQGTGAKDGKIRRCGTCGGRGQVAHSRGIFVMSSVCPTCQGAGSTASERCPECRGAGEKPLQRQVTVSIPAGVATGQTLRVGAQGQPGRNGGPPGHLYVHIEVEDDQRFQRDGDDLIHTLHLSFAQAALGAELEVATVVDDRAKIKVPSGSQPGDTVVLRGRGMPRVQGRGSGNMVIVLQVDVPKKLSKQARKCLEELDQLLSEA